MSKSICVALLNKNMMCLLPLDTSYRISFVSIAGLVSLCLGDCRTVIFQILNASLSKETTARSRGQQEKKPPGCSLMLLSADCNRTKSLLGFGTRNDTTQPYLCRAGSGNQSGERIIHLLEVFICSRW